MNGDAWRLVALVPPLAARLYHDGTEAGVQRLLALVVVAGLICGWAALFARRAGRPVGEGLLPCAVIFVILLPGPVDWFPLVLAVCFGAVFGREIFGGHPVLPPAAIGLAFAIFSFPEGGFELQRIFEGRSDVLLAISCLPGAACLIWKSRFSWRVVAGAAAGAIGAGLLMGDAAPWEHLARGTFAVGVIFLAAAPEGMPRRNAARWLHGLVVGALVVVIRGGDPDQPDGVVFAALLAGLFAPLLDRMVGWRKVEA